MAQMLGRCFGAVIAVIGVVTSATVPASAQPHELAPADFVALQDVDPTILQEIRYFTPHNFTGDPVDGYAAPMCILTRAAAEALARAQQDFLESGYTLKVYDCYRPQRAVDDFVGWAANLDDQTMKPEFYPRVDKSALFADGYIAERSGHSRGSTFDVTIVPLPVGQTPPYFPGQPLVDCAAPEPVRFPDNSVDMGTGFDCFDTLANTFDDRVAGDQAKNRLLLLEGLQRQGFVNYDKEWWHFTLRVEPYPYTYFNFPVDPRSVS
ncbi:MAG: M15 family metallopeptidase [Mycolicibacterium sp.]|uniref:M15 family metallopeptidase n=1 Tax=Mycolicibacterium sp. TaxID=2320850 RepID=UPI003D0D0857